MAHSGEAVTGTLSTFGPQVLSTRPTHPKARFGTASRTEKLAEKPFELKLLGATSHGVSTDVKSGLGPQTSSKNTTAPSIRFGNRYGSDHDMVKEARPGPGSYAVVESIGKQPLSSNATNPNWKVGTATRWAQYNKVFKEDFSTPAANDWRPSSGWLGDSPKFSFHGQGRRADISRGLPGQKPTNTEDPGPGTYEPPSSLGAQHDSRKLTSGRTRVGTADREKARYTQYISYEHEKDLYGKHSPAPNIYNPNLRMSSRVATPSGFRFGTGDRFSEVKSNNGQKLKVLTPGPGSYVI
mmetsp:Transcript_8955/g.19149  ORF Transcript_8955/g.19149 Transcript_8955/m.19149 type:complete len:296 (-) Transcript_8955:2094-2981(-)